MQQLFQQGINSIISLFILCLQQVQHARNCNKPLLRIVARQQRATSTINMILAVKEK
jgi:hypothetical protein